jgi:hypothetical protein
MLRVTYRVLTLRPIRSSVASIAPSTWPLLGFSPVALACPIVAPTRHSSSKKGKNNDEDDKLSEFDDEIFRDADFAFMDEFLGENIDDMLDFIPEEDAEILPSEKNLRKK